MPPDDDLESLLEAADIEPRLRRRLARYGALVLAANRRFNLTGSKSERELVEHLLDSLSVTAYLREPYVDVGSGAGLPAIPVALATGMPVTMIEATAKKAHFLESLLEPLGLRGRVLVERAEISGHREDLREQFASGTARAIGSAPTVAELLLPLIAPGGIAVLQRGTRDEGDRAALDDASLMLGGFVESESRIDRDRVILLVRKRGPTPARFPRRPGIPAKRPLCL
jgi:16S rRNA (guanine527-N7)-methyltransferase